LLYKPVRDNLRLADWVSLKMDAGNSTTWKAVNRPPSDLNFENILSSIITFADEYKGILCTETMLVNGLNDSVENFSTLAELIKKINPQKAYLSIPTRPPVVKSVKPPVAEKLNLAWQIFNKMNIKTEFLAGFEGTETGFTGNIYEDILNITAVHPLREDSLIKLLQNDSADYEVVKSLIKQRLIKASTYEGNKFYLREYNLQI
jgi:wyosine [tRNA(Phe)-imidazoG37] synthetase (radical SAM superfamily)